MAGKKGQIPSHVQQKTFTHPGVDNPIIQKLESVEDPRSPSLFTRYSLTSVLFMTLVSTMCGATDWPKVVVISNGIKEWLSKYIDMSFGVPCERTFKNIMNALNPEAIERVLNELSSILRKNKSQEVVSFDGQTARGTASKNDNLSGIHLVSAWSSENAICLGQLKVDDKSNEIKAIPELMELLDLKGTIVTADALNTQKTIAEKAIAKGGDYLFPVKGNHPSLLQDIELAFKGLEEEQNLARSKWTYAIAKAKEHRDQSRLEKLMANDRFPCGSFSFQSEIEKSHGRIEVRKCITLPVGNLPFKSDWKSVASIVRIDRERTLEGKTSHETIYYISSVKADKIDIIEGAARNHWGVENGLHWRLDVVFRQDKSRYRDRVGARNLAAVRKIVLNILQQDNTIKGGSATKMCAAACDPGFRDSLIKNLF